ncbi:NACHT, LRR and PYD domains-containing protein 3 [Geodia barretti]|uniref:NACHT, LRR and PYD domains-containing protein 3 n=1 Tax=Geodia barretti TaxID=519541 RepID=A0AA35R9M3_GEOBA|nr:NACHT, LRR and PYD domains-containing protein 3 [Geodia barretti]
MSPSHVGDLTTPPSKRPCYPSLPPVLLRYAEYLRSVYANAPPTYPDKLSPEVNTPYIKLALVKGTKVSNLQDANELTRLTLEGDLDLIFQHKEEISMDKVFTLGNDSKLRLVIVEGAPGIGKSTFVLELCRQWPKMLSLQPFSLVVLLKLRDEEIRLAEGVGDLLPWEDHRTDHATLVEEVMKRHGKGVLFLFDGFDEFPAHLRQSPSASYVMKVLTGKALPRATVLVTSRPSARIHLQPLMLSDSIKLIEVVGFGEEQIQQFAANVFGPESETLASFNDYLNVNPVIRSMMYNPLNCSIITEVYSETSRSKKPVPHTQTQLYTEMALWRLSRYILVSGTN